MRDLKDFWEKEKGRIMAGKEVYVLRNLSRGKGVGFFENSGFYPDFILWVVDTQRQTQRIIFVEPHGMLHAKAYIHDEKARLHERLPELAKKLAATSNQTGISLDAYIISATPYEKLYQHYDDGTWDRGRFANKHILFQERKQEYDYIQIVLCTSDRALHRFRHKPAADSRSRPAYLLKQPKCKSRFSSPPHRFRDSGTGNVNDPA